MKDLDWKNADLMGGGQQMEMPEGWIELAVPTCAVREDIVLELPGL